MKYAYLALGKLYYCDGDRPPQLIDSPFARDVVKRALERQQKHSWKTGGASMVASMTRQSMVDGNFDPRLIKVNITAVAPGNNPDELIYTVTTDAVGGLFSYNLKSGTEIRIFHKENLHLSDFDGKASDDTIACCQRFPNGTASISLRKGLDVSQITEGDSVDEAPSWVRDNDNQLVYQSAGVARNQAGMMMGLGPSSIECVDLSTGEVHSLAADDGHDYLCPRANSRNDLYFIKRPYEPIFNRAYPWHKMLLDAILFPFRMVRALFHFLNFFSMAFSKKPLTAAGGPKLEGPDEKSIFLRGKLIDAQQLLANTELNEEALHLVPKTWQLIHLAPDGRQVTICDGVLAYDLASEGIIYSTGAALYACNRDGADRKLLHKEKFIDTVLALD